MANDIRPILVNFSRNVVNAQWRLVCRHSASLIFTFVNDNRIYQQHQTERGDTGAGSARIATGQFISEDYKQYSVGG